MPDWNTGHSTFDTRAGFNMAMPGEITLGSGRSYFGPNLTKFVQKGILPEVWLDDMARRIS